jgi:hypothetical protein
MKEKNAIILKSILLLFTLSLIFISLLVAINTGSQLLHHILRHRQPTLIWSSIYPFLINICFLVITIVVARKLIRSIKAYIVSKKMEAAISTTVTENECRQSPIILHYARQLWKYAYWFLAAFFNKKVLIIGATYGFISGMLFLIVFNDKGQHYIWHITVTMDLLYFMLSVIIPLAIAIVYIFIKRSVKALPASVAFVLVSYCFYHLPMLLKFIYDVANMVTA